MTNSRRQFFQTLTGAMALANYRSAAAQTKRNMIVRSSRPEDFEMPLDGFADWITPIDRFYVRSHHYTPTVKLEDWTNPKDGKVYVVAMPTWKNNGKEAVRQVMFAAAIKGDNAQQPKNDTDSPQFFGGTVEPGTTIEPKRVPEDGVVLGEKEALQDLKADSVEMTAIASDKDYVPPKGSGV